MGQPICLEEDIPSKEFILEHTYRSGKKGFISKFVSNYPSLIIIALIGGIHGFKTNFIKEILKSFEPSELQKSIILASLALRHEIHTFRLCLTLLKPLDMNYILELPINLPFLYCVDHYLLNNNESFKSTYYNCKNPNVKSRLAAIREQGKSPKV